jgi:D-alanyl-D-alanine carboxypeptidase
VGRERAEPRGYDDWAVTLVDTTFRLPRSYEPPGLVSTTEAGFPTDVPMRRLALDDLIALREAAEAEEIHLDVTFGYRSFRLQKILFREWLTRRPRAEVLATVARPGHSEHQLGTSLDFTTAGTGPPDPGWGNTAEGAWLAEHAHEFGFVESYPQGRRGVTCYAAEPWHFRYVGPELARVVKNTPHTLREHLWCLRETGSPCATLGAE